MSSKKWKLVSGMRLPPLSVLAIAWSSAFGAEYWLRADTVDVMMPDGATIPMWGFALDNETFDSGNPATVPGPTLTVPPGDGTLTVHLKNNGLPEPVSIVIPGQIASMTPVKVNDANGRPRVRSFTDQTSAGETKTYRWTNLRPGTYLYHSGTHPQVQVQMGLYGGLKKDDAGGRAYPNVDYDNEIMLLYSEIDPALHAAVAGGTYGGPAYPSTIDYKPKYFLINGEPYDANSPPPFSAGAAGERTLIRFLNAGLQTHVPVLQGLDMQLVAEDGHPYPYVKTQYSAMLPAAKTLDAMLTPTPGQDGQYAIYDRRLNLTNGMQPGGGMLAYLTVGAAAPGAPVAANDGPYTTNEDTPLSIAAPGVLGNDTGPSPLAAALVSTTSKGTLSLSADGSFTYTPTADTSGIDSFSYKAISGSISSNVAMVSISVTPVNDPPLARNDAYSMIQGGTLNIAAPGVLANDSDPDAGDTLTAVNFGTASNGTVTGNTNGGFTYTPTAAFTGTATFAYQARDSSGAANSTSAPATVSITVNPNQAPLARDDTATTRTNTTVLINVIANDTDPDGSINPSTVTIVTQPNRRGTATPNANGTVTYTPRLNFRGSDAFTYTVRDNLDTTSNVATVRVNVTR
jgi:hypothetical protein